VLAGRCAPPLAPARTTVHFSSRQNVGDVPQRLTPVGPQKLASGLRNPKLRHKKREASGQEKKQSQLAQSGSYDGIGKGPFTQEDPIGLAGGMNLYGFAGGDPVNYSDPFGLCPPEKPLCQWIEAISMAAGADLGAMFGGGAGLLAGPGALVATPAGAIAGAAAGAGAGLAVGKAITNVLFSESAGSSSGEASSGDQTRGLRKQLEAHKDKLTKYRADPDAFDNKGLLKNATPELREKIINGRIRNLEGQIKNFEDQIKTMSGGKP
jgi:RHS repeat-associated protein